MFGSVISLALSVFRYAVSSRALFDSRQQILFARGSWHCDVPGQVAVWNLFPEICRMFRKIRSRVFHPLRPVGKPSRHSVVTDAVGDGDIRA